MAVAADILKTKCWLVLLVVAACSCALAEVKNVEVRRSASVTCEVAPHWTALQVTNDEGVKKGEPKNPMLENKGKVIAVVFTSAASRHSLEQAQKLGYLESYFHGIDMPDVKFILVNSALSQNHLQNLLLLNLTMTIVQESSQGSVWSKLSGKKDDVHVYDRCGRLTYAIPFPLSTVHPRQQLVESSVISTYLDDLCGERKCNGETNNSTADDSADSELLNTTHSDLIDITQLANVTEQEEIGGENFTEFIGGSTNSTESKDEDQTSTEYGQEDNLQSSFNRSSIGKYLNSRPKQSSESDLAKWSHRTQLLPATTTAEPSLLNGLKSLYHNVMKHMPWASKEDPKVERQVNSVHKFMDLKEPEEEVEDSFGRESPVSPIAEATAREAEAEIKLCNITQTRVCKTWSKKKLDHARVCCNLHSCNRSAQYLQKHCNHYSKHRCQKVELVLKCCHNRTSDEEGNSTASPFIDPTS